jgi:CDP-diacylglycerol---serine O-phosphatidyltransferase
MFLVPNLITLSAMACGLVAVTIANETQAFGTAAAFVLLGAILDSLDGRIARMTGTQSEFGVQLDSLSDAIAFGVAPALLMHAFALREFGSIGLAVCCVYAACAIVRLARFNVHAADSHDDGPGRFMVGLSVPVSAAILVALVGIDVTTDVTLRGTARTLELAVAMTALGGLMVSTVPFRSFKDLRMDPSTLAIMAGIIGAAIGAWVVWTPAIALAGLLTVYLAQGFIELVRRTVAGDA